MKLFIKIATMFCTTLSPMLIANHAAIASEFSGVQKIAAPSKERGNDLAVIVWYPTDRAGRAVPVGESIFFKGTEAIGDAPISPGKYPLILLSHGSGLGGSPQAISWIASPLAKLGFIVAAPTHPGNGGANRSAAETIKIWLRPKDITETLNMMEQQPFFKNHLDYGKVGVLGVSMGGSTALALAGARMDPIRLAGYCDTDTLNPSLCEWVKESGVNLHSIDMELADRDNKDSRIKFAMAIDPVPVDVILADTLTKISIPVEIVNLGQRGTIPLTTFALETAKAIPNGSYTLIEAASHYSMLGECKPNASEIAESENIGDPICSDGSGQSRLEIHRQLVNMVAEAFGRELKMIDK